MDIEYILLAVFSIASIICIIINEKGKKKWKIIEEAKNEELKKRLKIIEETKNEELKNIFKERWDKEEQDFKLKKTELQIKEKEIESEIAKLKTSLTEKEKRYEEVNQDLDLYREGKLKEIDGTAAEYEQRKRIIITQSIDEYRNELMKLANEEMNALTIQKNEMLLDIDAIKSILEEERRKRDTINEEILRQRKVAEEQDFYKIKFSEQDKNDIEILRPIAPRLQHPEVINKIIWNSYYQKPLAELRKRLLPNGDKSGIYKITRIKTNEIYIGQTTSFDRRFQDHVKTALGVGTLASSQLHRVMAEDGPENFYFEILEEVEKDKLKERESYYIDWFKSNKFGLNTIRGQQHGI